jgi:hypothetical protein
MRNRIMVHGYGNQFTHHSVGKEFYIDFMSYPGDPGQFEIVPSEENPLVG